MLARHFASKGLPVPHILSVAKDEMSYEVTDLGDISLFDAIKNGRETGTFDTTEKELLKKTIREHRRIIFEGNGYSKEWEIEAEKRGLSNLKSTVDALPAFISDKAIEVFTKHEVFSKTELMSRYEILLENYYKIINIEALTLISMTKKDIMAAACKYEYAIAKTINEKSATGIVGSSKAEKKKLETAAELVELMSERLEKLEADVEKGATFTDAYENAKYHREVIFESMNSLREVIDKLEVLVPSDMWPYPTYGEILYSVK